MPNFREMFFLVAVPTEGYLYNVRICRLQPFAPVCDVEIQAGVLWDWLKRYGYELSSCSVDKREAVVLAQVSEMRIMRLGFMAEQLMERCSIPAGFAQLATPIGPLVKAQDLLQHQSERASRTDTRLKAY
jgi:hypothetical protein